MHHYEFNIGDYRKDTGHLTLLEHGVYRMLIDSYYANEGPLCADDAKLMRTHCIRSADEQQAYRNIMDDFFELRDGYYHHDGCDKVLNKIYSKSASARASAQERWRKKNANASKSDANAMRTECEEHAPSMLPITHNPITHNPEKNSPDGELQKLPRQRFQKPSLADLISEFTGRVFDPGGEAQKFLAYYESNGWKVGKNPMKSWQATVTTWVTRSNENANSNHGTQLGEKPVSGIGKLSTVGRNSRAADAIIERNQREAASALHGDGQPLEAIR